MLNFRGKNTAAGLRCQLSAINLLAYGFASKDMPRREERKTAMYRRDFSNKHDEIITIERERSSSILQ